MTYATSQKHEDKPVVTAVDWSTDLSAGVRLLLAAASQLALAPFPELKESPRPFPLREPDLHPLCPVWGEKTRSWRKRRRISERKCVFTISTHFLVSGTSYKSALQKIHAQRPIGRTLKTRWQCSDSSIAAVYTCTASHVKRKIMWKVSTATRWHSVASYSSHSAGDGAWKRFHSEAFQAQSLFLGRNLCFVAKNCRNNGSNVLLLQHNADDNLYT